MKTMVVELKARAKRNGRKLGEEVRAMLLEQILRHRLEMADRLETMREAIRSEYGDMPDSTEYIRQQRDQRG